MKCKCNITMYDLKNGIYWCSKCGRLYFKTTGNWLEPEHLLDIKY